MDSHTLLLKLRGPLQAWGTESRYTTRSTENAPTKSGVLGMLAAAQGRRRTDSLEDLADLRFGVRVDQPGTLIRDFQTAIDWRTGKSNPLSYRYYLSDAVFIAGVSGHTGLLEALEDALRKPKFPVYLGRRSCPANSDLLMGIMNKDVESALRAVDWQASKHYRRTRSRKVQLPLLLDSDSPGKGDLQRDVPVSFDPVHRKYDWRKVDSTTVEKENGDGRKNTDDFFEVVSSA